MTYAYDKICLERASDTLGRMLDYSVYSLHYDIPSMMDLFIASGAAAGFERCDIRMIAGMSGIELAYDVLERIGLTFERTQPRYTKTLSAEYWCGYALVQIQWASCVPFSRIMKFFSTQNFISNYGQKRLAFLDQLPLDISEEERKAKLKDFGTEAAMEAVYRFMSDISTAQQGAPGSSIKGSSVSKNVSAANTDGSILLASAYRLKYLRLKNGLSQSELARASGIPVRTIQQYEQRQKDLSKARAEYLIALARALNCDPATLLTN